MSKVRLQTLLCAAWAVISGPMESPARAADVPPANVGSAAGFSPGTIGPLLIAEVESRQGDESALVRSARTYLEAARDHRDAGLAKRATRIASRAAHYDLAADAASLWRELDPESLPARQTHALMLVRSGRSEETVSVLRHIVRERGGGSPSGHEVVLEVLLRDSDVSRRVRLMNAVADASREARFALARLLARSDESARALEILNVLRREAPEDNRYAVTQARVLDSGGDLASALELLAAFGGPENESDRIRLNHAQLLTRAGRPEEASRRYAILVERHPDDDGLRWELGRLLTELERFEEARPHFERLRLSPDWRDPAWYFIGLIEEAGDGTDRALLAYRRVRDGSFYVSARIRTATIIADRGHLEWARWHLAAAPRNPGSEDIHLFRAESYLFFRAKHYAEAMTILDSAIGIYPENPGLLYDRAMAAEKLDRLDILERDLRSILDRDPDHVEALNALGYTLADRTERYDEARELVEHAYALEPGRAHIIDSMGWVFYRLERHEEAAEYLRRAYELDPAAEIGAHLGEVLWMLGRRDEAREIWASALESDPGNEVLLETLERFGE